MFAYLRRKPKPRLTPMYRRDGVTVYCVIRACLMTRSAYRGLLPVVIPQ